VNGTKDVLSVSGEFAFGGEYQLSLIKLNADSWANRTEIELPSAQEDVSGGSGGARKRRVMRTISRVLPTEDAQLALLVMAARTTRRPCPHRCQLAAADLLGRHDAGVFEAHGRADPLPSVAGERRRDRDPRVASGARERGLPRGAVVRPRAWRIS
jgi:hypothetical protein